MPLELQPGENVLFPAPYVPTEHHALIITSKRVVQYAAMGPYPIGEFEVSKIEHIGRMSERPYLIHAVLVAIVGLILLIVAGTKVLPHCLKEGPKDEGPEVGKTADGRTIEGKDEDDEFPVEDGEGAEGKARALAKKAGKLKDLKNMKLGLPPWSDDIETGLVLIVLGLPGVGAAHILRKRRRHYIFCRVPGQVHRIEVASEIQQNMILGSLNAAQQTAAALGGAQAPAAMPQAPAAMPQAPAGYAPAPGGYAPAPGGYAQGQSGGQAPHAASGTSGTPAAPYPYPYPYPPYPNK